MGKKEQKVVQMKKRSWKELLNYKKRRDIIYDGEIIFTIEELGGSEFDDFFNSLITKGEKDEVDVSENNEDDNESITLDSKNGTEKVAFLLRKMVKGDIANFEDMTDQEVVDTLNMAAPEVIKQVNTALFDFVYERFNEKTKELTELYERYKKLEEDVNGKQEGDEEQTNQESELG